jgi:hypothetical protein
MTRLPAPPMARSGGRRRIDRVLDPGYLDGLEIVPVATLRDRRQEALREETDLSYLRRMLQGRVDILRAELHRRIVGDPGNVLAELPAILRDAPSDRTTSVRHLSVAPSRVGEYRREVEAVLADVELSDLTARADAELSDALQALDVFERQVSDYRRRVQQVADRCGAELAHRYREGRANVDDLLRTEDEQS